MNLRNKNNLKSIGVFAAVLISVLAGVFLTFRLAFFLLPFLIAFALSSLMEPLLKLLTKKLHIKRKIAAPIMLLLMLAFLIFLLVLIVLKLVSETKILIQSAPANLSDFYSQIIEWTEKWTMDLTWLPPEITANLGSVTNNLGNVISNLSSTITTFGKTIVKGAFTTAISFPEAIVFTIITIMATYFMSSDREKISAAFTRHLPESWMQRIINLKKDMFSTIFGYLRAALIIMSFTFIELFIGFNIIPVKYPLLLAFLIAIIDALPVLGTGGVLIPWSLFSFVTNDIKMGIYILALYLVVLVIRQIIEPKVVGHQIGVYPLLTLLAMYTGLQLIGFAGLILGPITFVLIRNILITIYKNKTLKDIIVFDSEDPGNPS